MASWRFPGLRGRASAGSRANQRGVAGQSRDRALAASVLRELGVEDAGGKACWSEQGCPTPRSPTMSASSLRTVRGPWRYSPLSLLPSRSTSRTTHCRRVSTATSRACGTSRRTSGATRFARLCRMLSPHTTQARKCARSQELPHLWAGTTSFLSFRSQTSSSSAFVPSASPSVTASSRAFRVSFTQPAASPPSAGGYLERVRQFASCSAGPFLWETRPSARPRQGARRPFGGPLRPRRVPAHPIISHRSCFISPRTNLFRLHPNAAR